MFERIFAGVAGSLATASIIAIWHYARVYLKKRRKLESDVVIVDQSITQDKAGQYNFNVILRNDAESSAVITGAKLVCEFKHKFELVIQAVSKITPSAHYDYEINPDDYHKPYTMQIRQLVPAKNVDHFTIRINSSSNNWICVFKIILLVNENAKELHSQSIGVYFEDRFDGWGLDNDSAQNIQRRLTECKTKTKSVAALLDRMANRSNQNTQGWVIYIPEATLSAVEAQGGNRDQLISDFLLRQSEPSIFLSVDGLDEPVEIAKCGFVERNLVVTVGHVVHNRRTGERFKPSRLFVMPRTGYHARILIRAETYWLLPKPKGNRPVEGFAYIKLTHPAENVRIIDHNYQIPDFKTHGEQIV